MRLTYFIYGIITGTNIMLANNLINLVAVIIAGIFAGLSYLNEEWNRR